MKPLLVGEDNPYGSDPRYALYPEPEYSAGGRLCRLIMQMTVRQYIRAFERVNLCSGKWSMPEAKAYAKKLAAWAYHSGTPMVLLGSKVAGAFGLKFDPFTYGDTVFGEVGDALFSVRIVQLPHPSGRNRMWNEPGSIEKATRMLQEAGILPKEG